MSIEIFVAIKQDFESSQNFRLFKALLPLFSIPGRQFPMIFDFDFDLLERVTNRVTDFIELIILAFLRLQSDFISDFNNGIH